MNTKPTTATDIRPGDVIVNRQRLSERTSTFTVLEITTRDFRDTVVYTLHGYTDVYGGLSGPQAVSLFADEVVDVAA